MRQPVKRHWGRGCAPNAAGAFPAVFRPVARGYRPTAHVLAVFLLFLAPGCAAPSDWDAVPQIVERIRLPDFPARDYDVTEFGAEEGGDVRSAVHKAIRQANEAGGGRVVIPKGTWHSRGPIHLKSNVELHVSEGAVLRFSDDPTDYLPSVLTRWEGTELFNYSPLIYAYQAANVALTGGGIIDGNAEHGFGTWRPSQGPAQDRLRAMGEAGVPVHERVFGDGDFLRPSMIQFFGCGDVLVEGVTVHDSPMWVIHFVYSHNITVRGVTVESFRLNNDGIGIDSSVNVLIEDNDLRTGDDSIVIKSGRDADGWRVGRSSENIVIRNNRMTGHNALAIGSEMSGGVRNVFMERNELGEVLSAIYFKSNLDRGGAIEHVRVRDIHVDEAETLLRFHTDYHGHRGGSHPARYRDFVIENVTARRVETAIEAVGAGALPIRDVIVRNMTVGEAATPLVAEHVEGLVLENVSVNGEIITSEP